MNKAKLISVSKDTICYLTCLSPLAFSMAVCFDQGEIIATMFACLAILFAPIKRKKIMPVYLSFMLLWYASVAFDMGVTFWACILCGILLIISSFFFEKLIKLFSAPTVSGVMLATALSSTVLFTTHYFGIGAKGNTVMEMIDSYISLGFHPNWRGVLYGTIVMVIMITFPRKFKKLTKTVSPAFIAIVSTLIINLFLNPSDMVTAINEIHDGTKWQAYLSFLPAKAAFSFSLSFENILAVISIAAALFITYFHSIAGIKDTSKKDILVSGIANAVSGGVFRLPFPYGINKNKGSFLPRILAASIMFLMFYFGEKTMLRIPVHSCAVVIIVGAWQSVKWDNLKKVFTGVTPVLCFVVCVLACLITDLVYGIIISFLISVLYSCFLSKLKVFEKS